MEPRVGIRAYPETPSTTEVVGNGHDLGRLGQRGSQTSGDRMGVALGYRKHQPQHSERRQGEHRRRRVRDRDRRRRSTPPRLARRPSSSRARWPATDPSGSRVAMSARWPRARRAPTKAGSRTSELRSQRSGAIRARGCVRSPGRRCSRTCSDHAGEGLRRRHVAVNHGEGLTIVAAHPDLDADVAVAHYHPCHFEARRSPREPRRARSRSRARRREVSRPDRAPPRAARGLRGSVPARPVRPQCRIHAILRSAE